MDTMQTEKTPEEMARSSAFDLVSDMLDWKAPINCLVHPGCFSPDGITIEAVCEAVVFYTATKATVTHERDGMVRFKADGYRMGPAGDH